jgi:hypothetical protein
MWTAKKSRLPALWAVAAVVFSANAVAQEYCVTCSGPEASYRCVIGGEVPPAVRASSGQFLCITELAKAGGHLSCSAARGQATPCAGETRTVMYSLADPAGALAPGAPPPAAPATGLSAPPPAAGLPPIPERELAPVPLPPVDQTQAPSAPPAETGTAPSPPKPSVVEDLANKTGKAVSDTGKAVGDAAKKSWDCVASLFGNC